MPKISQIYSLFLLGVTLPIFLWNSYLLTFFSILKPTCDPSDKKGFPVSFLVEFLNHLPNLRKNDRRNSGGTLRPKISQRYPKDIPKISSKYPQNIPKISPKYPQNIPKISQKYSKNIPKIFQKYSKNIPKISPRYPVTSIALILFKPLKWHL